MKIYSLIEGDRVLRMSRDKQELINYRNSFPLEERKEMWIAEKQVKNNGQPRIR